LPIQKARLNIAGKDPAKPRKTLADNALHVKFDDIFTGREKFLGCAFDCEQLILVREEPTRGPYEAVDSVGRKP
jgi:hypothetical protein